VNHESRKLIDGNLVESETGCQCDNINPAADKDAPLSPTKGT
jgi:hypothetical protein